MKLNVKRTFLVGLAFMAISAFWQLYDQSVPMILSKYYTLGDTAIGAVMAMDNVIALFMLPLFGMLSDHCKLKMGRRIPFMLIGGITAAVFILTLPITAKFASVKTFLILLGILLLVMATFRSPTVALMPDVTPKPLRSKANAIINLMGAIGGALVLGLVNFLLVETTIGKGKVVSDYTWLYLTVAVLMVGAMLIIRRVIPERQLAAEVDEINRKLETEKAPMPTQVERKLTRSERASLALILCSVALWFMGYNAVTSAFSRYAVKVFIPQTTVTSEASEALAVTDEAAAEALLPADSTAAPADDAAEVTAAPAADESAVPTTEATTPAETANTDSEQDSEKSPESTAAEKLAANCVLVATVVAIISYWPVGLLSSKIGRKKMIIGGIVLLMIAFFGAALLRSLSVVAFILFALVGMGWASIGVNSYPMVVELASGSDVGKYTGYYYTFSMAAQVLTPILSGALLEHVGYWTLFPYAFVMLTLAMLTMSRVKHGDSKPEAKRGIEALDVDD